MQGLPSPLRCLNRLSLYALCCSPLGPAETLGGIFLCSQLSPQQGCTIVAPHFERLIAPTPTESELRLRARRLRLAFDHVARPGLPLVGVGHSIGATMLLALAGAEIWMPSGRRLVFVSDPRPERLVLLTPAMAFFAAQGALDRIRTPILAWAGSKDLITPPSDVEALRQALASQAAVDVRVVEDAGHFSFMNEPPPHTVEPLREREAFLARLAEEVCQFVLG